MGFYIVSHGECVSQSERIRGVDSFEEAKEKALYHMHDGDVIVETNRDTQWREWFEDYAAPEIETCTKWAVLEYEPRIDGHTRKGWYWRSEEDLTVHYEKV